MSIVTTCRVCQGQKLDEVIDLGNQPLSGVFPQDNKELVSSGNLQLMRCSECGLVQLGTSFSSKEMYGENYGYRSGLNSMMVNHLERIAQGLIRKIGFKDHDVICDIGSNDGTFLKNFEGKSLKLIGIDPTAKKYLDHYSRDITVVSDFFSADNYFNHQPKQAKDRKSVV